MNNTFLNMASIGDFDPLNSSIPATKVEITVSCRNLLDMDTFSKSDPSKRHDFGRTEVIDNTLNPDFVRKFMLDYFFEERQNLRFDLYDVDSKSANLQKHVSPSLDLPFSHCIQGKKCGTIIVKAEELNNCRVSNWFTICHKTEVVKNTLNPVWQAFKIPVRALCNGDYDSLLFFICPCSHDYIGEFSTSYRELSIGQSQFNIYEVSLNVTLLSFLVDVEVTFLDYIKGGTQINFTVAIDFTASNGNPAQPTSLHYMSPYQLNAYAMALKAVGEIIQDYDSDKMFPALGFGAKLPPDGRVSHEFALNGNPQNPYCAGIDGVMEAYYQSLKSVQLYGPTNFSPVINHVARYAASVKDGSQYFVLLIITDGVISDMAQTKESIVNASCLPMSIIIVGVGPAEFDAMVELDGDEVRISSRGRFAERDIVQFVPFRDYIDRSGNHILSMARLAKDVLAEIPDQFLSYMRTRGIKPSPAPPPYTPPGQPVQTQI
uniref:Uncharacterized protein n=1 Tax=Xiphophorus couchianus TaxID=32473 RepID=A0A3B5MKU2_9TELE